MQPWLTSRLQDRQNCFCKTWDKYMMLRLMKCCNFHVLSSLFIASCEGQETTMYLRTIFSALSISLGLASALPTELDAADTSHLFQRAIGSACSTPVRPSYSSAHYAARYLTMCNRTARELANKRPAAPLQDSV